MLARRFLACLQLPLLFVLCLLGRRRTAGLIASVLRDRLWVVRFRAHALALSNLSKHEPSADQGPTKVRPDQHRRRGITKDCMHGSAQPTTNR